MKTFKLSLQILSSYSKLSHTEILSGCSNANGQHGFFCHKKSDIEQTICMGVLPGTNAGNIAVSLYHAFIQSQFKTTVFICAFQTVKTLTPVLFPRIFTNEELM